MPKRKREFTVYVEAKLKVHAFDEDSARRKVEGALRRGRLLSWPESVDVAVTEELYVHDVVEMGVGFVPLGKPAG